MRKALFFLAVGFVIAVFSTSAMAAPYAGGNFQIGDVFAAVASGQVQVWRGGVNLGELNTGLGGFTTGMATDSSGNLYVTNFSVDSVSKFNNSGVLQGTFGSGNITPEDILFNAAGDAFVGGLGSGIRKFDSTGAFVASYYGGRVDWFDLKANQDTMLITDEGTTIHTLTLSTNTVGTDFATGLSHAFALRILANGDVLVADSGEIKRFNSAGVQIGTYDVTGEDTWFSLNLDPNGTSFWSGNFGSSNFYEFDIATGNLIGSAYNTATGSSTLFGLAVYGEITQGGGGVGTPIPEPGTMMLLGSGLVGLVGWGRKKFRK